MHNQYLTIANNRDSFESGKKTLRARSKENEQCSWNDDLLKMQEAPKEGKPEGKDQWTLLVSDVNVKRGFIAIILHSKRISTKMFQNGEFSGDAQEIEECMTGKEWQNMNKEYHSGFHAIFPQGTSYIKVMRYLEGFKCAVEHNAHTHDGKHSETWCVYHFQKYHAMSSKKETTLRTVDEVGCLEFDYVMDVLKLACEMDWEEVEVSDLVDWVESWEECECTNLMSSSEYLAYCFE